MKQKTVELLRYYETQLDRHDPRNISPNFLSPTSSVSDSYNHCSAYDCEIAYIRQDAPPVA